MLTRIKKRSALLLSLAVLCATVAIVPQAANAAGSKVPNAGTVASAHTAANNAAIMTSCPMDSAPAAGFTDTTSTDVDCIKLHGITQGTSATTYEPAASIPRWQMALFLHRMFVPTGLAAAGLTAVPAFTDTAGLSTEITDAISAIASHGITVGTTATTFSPNDNVSREQMALFLYRMGRLVAPFNSATVTTDGIFADNGSDIASASYNYTDIASASFEGMEAIVAMYNLGGTGEAATCVTGNLCETSYRPSEDITRLEMATMVKSVLDHSQARPPGRCTIQNDEALVTGNAEGTMISCRNADGSADSNVIVDEFYQVRNDTSATTAALSIPFAALTSQVNTSTGGVSAGGSGTTGTMDSADRVTNVRGNIDGANCAALTAHTCRHWIWTGDQGTIYVDGTTATGFLWEGSLAATATGGATYATGATSALDKAAFSATCDFSNIAGVVDNVVAADGECAYQGTTRTITTTFAGAATTAVVDGYTVKYTVKTVGYGGGTGNLSVTYTDTYVPTSGGVATLDITCSADPKPTTNNVADNGNDDDDDYWESHEIVADLGTAAGGTGYPVGGSDFAPGAVPSISCDDIARAYADGQHSLSVGKNWYNVSTGGTLASVTATARDQYGDGIAGVTARFNSATHKNVALTVEGTTTADRVSLLTGSDGTATYTTVMCDAASVGTSGSVEWAVTTPGANATTMGAQTKVNVNATLEGTTVYCVADGTDTVASNDENRNVNVTNEVITIAFTDDDDSNAAVDPKTGGKYTISVGDATSCGTTFTTGEIDGDATSADIVTAVELLTCITDVTVTANSTTYTSVVIAMLANTGDWPGAVVTEGTGGKKLVKHGGTNEVTATLTTVQGTYGTTFDFIDHDAADSSLLTKKTVKQRTAAGAAVVTSSYQRWTYDDTDVYMLANSNPTLALNGATKAQFETAMTAIAGFENADMSLVNRTGATSTGTSVFELTTG